MTKENNTWLTLYVDGRCQGRYRLPRAVLDEERLEEYLRDDNKLLEYIAKNKDGVPHEIDTVTLDGSRMYLTLEIKNKKNKETA